MLYFVYGSLKNPEFQKRLFGRSHQTRHATLYDHRLALVDMFPTVCRKPGKKVSGLLLNLSVHEEVLADRWEENTYEKVTVQVVHQSQLVTCLLYQSLLAPSRFIDSFDITPDLKKELQSMVLL